MEYGRLLGIITFLVGLLLAVGYECLICRDEREQDDREHKEKDGYISAIRGAVDKSHIDRVLKDYEIMNREVETRGNITLVVGTILITASFYVLGTASIYKEASSLKYAMAIVSITLYVLWLFVLNYTSKTLDNMTFSRMRAVEEALSDEKVLGYDFGIHRYIRGETGNRRWIEIRRRFWVWVLILLFIGWALVLSA